VTAHPLAVPPGLLRVVAIGSESTGKTDLTAWLAQALDVPWSSEYARDHAEARGGSDALTAADVDPIARGQLALEQRAIEEAGARGSPIVLHDTDLLSTLVYATAYYGEPAVPAWLRDALPMRRPALYLLCDIDVPWHTDSVRDEAADREAMQRRFVAAVEAIGIPHVRVRGDEGVRRARALEEIARLGQAANR